LGQLQESGPVESRRCESPKAVSPRRFDRAARAVDQELRLAIIDGPEVGWLAVCLAAAWRHLDWVASLSSFAACRNRPRFLCALAPPKTFAQRRQGAKIDWDDS